MLMRLGAFAGSLTEFSIMRLFAWVDRRGVWAASRVREGLVTGFASAHGPFFQFWAISRNDRVSISFCLQQKRGRSIESGIV